jgi:hypothetical protein
MTTLLDVFASQLVLGDLLETVRVSCAGYNLLHHHTQGEFHHDLVLRVEEPRSLPGPFLVVSTNCNGGVKEVLCTAREPDVLGVWRWRCPDNPEFAGEVPDILGIARTVHFFDPCELLSDDARSELREEHRERQPGGGWRMCAKH